MFNSYEMTRALITERQGNLHHEASQNRLARTARRGRRSTVQVRSLRPAVPPLPAAASHPKERAAA